MEKRGVFHTEGIITYLFIFALLSLGIAFLYFVNFEFTGMVILNQGDQINFDEGTYNNTLYNGSAVILSGTNLSGDYISKIFDSFGPALWNNLSLSRSLSTSINIFIVDGSGSVWKSTNSGATWTQQNSSYGGGAGTDNMASDKDGNLYIVFNQDIYKSTNSGITWSLVNDDFNPSDGNGGVVIISNSSSSIFIIDGSGDVWVSNNEAVSFTNVGDFNGGASNNAKGIAINSVDYIFIVDGSGSVWKSTNSGATWTQQNSSYGGGAGTDGLVVDSGGNLYILFNRAVYKSTNQGVTWSIINESFSSDQDGLMIISDENDNLFIADPSGDVFKSTDFGVTWNNVGDFNEGATNDIKGFTSSLQLANLTFQVRNCSLLDCSGSSFVGPDKTSSTFFQNTKNDLNLQSRYFQYKFYFSRDDSIISPELISVSLDYSPLAPEINIISPNNLEGFNSNTNLPLNFTITNATNLDACWYTLDNGINNVTILSCVNTTFDASDSDYELKLYVNDTLGNVGKDSVNFTVSAIGVSLTIIQPSGTKTSRTGIPITYTSIGNNMTCWYNVKTSIGGSVINNKTLTGCLGETFDVSNDGDYVLNLFVNNSLGATDFDSSSFSVLASSPGSGDGSSGGSSSGGSSSGGTVIIQQTFSEISVGNISNIIIYFGETKSITWEVENTGTKFLNDCSLESLWDYNSWINGLGGIKDLAAGERYEFIFNLNVPEDVESGSYEMIVSLNCKEIKKSVNFNVEIIEKELNLRLIEIIRERDSRVKVIYSLEELSGIDQNVNLEFLLFDGNEKVAEGSETKFISANSVNEFEIFIDIDPSLGGNLNLLVNMNSESSSAFVQENIILGSPITGFTLFGNDGRTTTIISYVILILFLIFSSFVIRRIFQHRKKLKNKGKNKKEGKVRRKR